MRGSTPPAAATPAPLAEIAFAPPPMPAFAFPTPEPEAEPDPDPLLLPAIAIALDADPLAPAPLAFAPIAPPLPPGPPLAPVEVADLFAGLPPVVSNCARLCDKNRDSANLLIRLFFRPSNIAEAAISIFDRFANRTTEESNIRRVRLSRLPTCATNPPRLDNSVRPIDAPPVDGPIAPSPIYRVSTGAGRRVLPPSRYPLFFSSFSRLARVYTCYAHRFDPCLDTDVPPLPAVTNVPRRLFPSSRLTLFPTSRIA